MNEYQRKQKELKEKNAEEERNAKLLKREVYGPPECTYCGKDYYSHIEIQDITGELVKICPKSIYHEEPI